MVELRFAFVLYCGVVLSPSLLSYPSSSVGKKGSA